MPVNEPPQFSSHFACQTLTGITLDHLPRDRADRIYFLKRGQVTVMTGDARGHEVILK